jgi:hypothetical protein
MGGLEVGTMAFADNFVILAGSIKGTQDYVDQVVGYMYKVGMNLYERKSSSFLMTSMRIAWVVWIPDLSIGETTIILLPSQCNLENLSVYSPSSFSQVSALAGRHQVLLFMLKHSNCIAYHFYLVLSPTKLGYSLIIFIKIVLIKISPLKYIFIFIFKISSSH